MICKLLRTCRKTSIIFWCGKVMFSYRQLPYTHIIFRVGELTRAAGRHKMSEGTSFPIRQICSLRHHFKLQWLRLCQDSVFRAEDIIMNVKLIFMKFQVEKWWYLLLIGYRSVSFRPPIKLIFFSSAISHRFAMSFVPTVLSSSWLSHRLEGCSYYQLHTIRSPGLGLPCIALAFIEGL